ncbi:hypothetical protein EW145_g5270 [Phellinidium pouzarii]|uniref:Uncharacterized protein n=1 Tax=Phellinidium pouzarii TaxID=167371 RepID=A0A4S4L0K9_9AGAM|nr:hypothetical protein EW145_g5270 [Phellinidium pouzarii]
MLTQPTAHEGFERIFHLRPSDHLSPVYTKDELQAILLQVATSPPLSALGVPQRGIREYFGDGRSRGERDRGGWRGRVHGHFPQADGVGSPLNRASDRPRQHNIRHPGSESTSTSWRRRENVFQDDHVVTGLASHAISRDPELATPSKHSGSGSAEFPTTID